MIAPKANDKETPPSASAHQHGLIARNFLSLSAVSIAERLIGLFSNIYARRALGSVSIGQVVWTAAVISYFNILVNPGMQTIAKREVARDPRQTCQFVTVLFLLQGVLALASLLFIWWFGALAIHANNLLLLLVLQALGLLLLPLDLSWILFAKERMAPLALANLVSYVFQVLALLLFIGDPSHTVRYILLAYPFRLAVNVFSIYYSIRNRLFDWRSIRFGFTGSRALILESIPLGLSQATILLYYNADALFLRFFRDDATVGIYSTAYSMMLVPSFLSSALLNSYFPSLARSIDHPDQAKRTSEEFLRIMIWLGFPLAGLGWSVGRHLIFMLFGQEYAASGPLFEWLCLDLCLIFFNVGYNQPLTAWKCQSLVFRCTLAGAVVNLSLNLWLIPLYGSIGAVFTTILAEIAVLVAAVFARRNLIPLLWYKPILQVGAVSLVASVLTTFIISTGVAWWCALALGMFVCLSGFIFFEHHLLRKIIGAVQ